MSLKLEPKFKVRTKVLDWEESSKKSVNFIKKSKPLTYYVITFFLFLNLLAPPPYLIKFGIG